MRLAMPALLITPIFLQACNRPPAAPPATRTTANLAFTLTPPPGFASTKDGDKSKAWTSGGLPAAPDEPHLVLTRSSKVYPADDNVRRFGAEQLIRGINQLGGVVIVATKPITIDGMPGFETTAKAMAAGNNAPVRVYAAAVFAADGTFYVLGYDGGDDSLATQDLFRAAAQTLTVK